MAESAVSARQRDAQARMKAILSQIDRIPDRHDALRPFRVRRARPPEVIVVATSALVAVTFGEPERAVFLAAIAASRLALVSSVSAAAYAAFVVYGKGSGHAAGLNLGDLFSYALAKTRGLPLLFKGDDFAHTDIVSAVVSAPAQVPSRPIKAAKPPPR